MRLLSLNEAFKCKVLFRLWALLGCHVANSDEIEFKFEIFSEMKNENKKCCANFVLI